MQDKVSNYFSTQSNMLQQLNIQNSNGLCSPLANLYASYRMGKGTRDFLYGGPLKTYEAAKEMEKHQENVEREVSAKTGNSFGNLVGMHIAFFDSRKKFKAVRTSVEELSTTEGAKNVLKDSEHVLINYPTDDTQRKSAPYHQVYYGHTIGNRCSYFNANMAGGEREGTCDEILKTFVEDIRKLAAHDGRDCIIGRSL
jgi:hypothetical protein